MRFDFDQVLKKFNGDFVPVRALKGGLGDSEQEKVQEVGDALSKLGLSSESIQRVLELGMNANDEPLTLRETLVTILIEGIEEKGRTPDGHIIPKQIEGRAKIRRGKLAEKIWDGGIVDIDDKERSLAKDTAAAILGTELAYLVYRAFEKPVVAEVDKEDDDVPKDVDKTDD